MRRYLLLIFALLVSACQMQGEAVTPSLSTPETKPKLVMVNYSETPVPTATIDYQSTIAVAEAKVETEKQASYQAQQRALDAEKAVVAANVVIIGYTASHEEKQVVIAQITHSVYLTNEVHIASTETAMPTAIAGTQTQQVFISGMLTQNSTSITATHEAPELMMRTTAAIYEQQWGWVNYLASGVLSVGTVGMFIFIAWYLTRRPSQPTASATDNKSAHFRVNRTDGQLKMKRIRNEVPCTVEQLMALAEGIRHGGMSLAINPWQSTIVHKSLDDIRQFFLDNEFARVLKTKKGELFLLDAGEDWLDECLELGEPPLPYVCSIPSPEPVSGSNLVPVT